jgi:hypothetical protein
MPLTKTTVNMIEATGTPSSGNFLRGDGAWSNVGVSQLSATGTPSSSTFLRGDGTWNAPPASITAMTAQSTTSGTFKDFTGIPAGVERITVMFNNVSLSLNESYLIQLGTGSTTYTTTGYTSTSTLGTSGGNSIQTSTSGFIMGTALAAGFASGHITITNISGNIWVSSATLKRGTDGVLMSGGDVTLGAALTAIRITSNGTSTFDSGSINILYEF